MKDKKKRLLLVDPPHSMDKALNNVQEILFGMAGKLNPVSKAGIPLSRAELSDVTENGTVENQLPNDEAMAQASGDEMGDFDSPILGPRSPSVLRQA